MMNTIQELMDKYGSWFEYLNARVYGASPEEDIKLLRLWMALHETGEIDRLVVPDAHNLTAFMNLFRYPVGTIYATNEEGEIDNIAWFGSIDSKAKYHAANGAMYCSPSCRGKKRQLYFGYLAYSLALDVYDAIIGYTWQPDLLKVHQSLGYEINGCVPHIHDKEFVYIVRLTREAFAQSKFMQTVNHLTKRRS
jgi:hypothetical protein